MRTTVERVKALLDVDISVTDLVIASFIETATTLVTDALGTSALTDTTLEEIERWLTAHLIAYTLERQSKSEEAGSAKIVYAGDLAQEGLKGTTYGQMAVSLDTTGTLKSLYGGEKRIQFLVP